MGDFAIIAGCPLGQGDGLAFNDSVFFTLILTLIGNVQAGSFVADQQGGTIIAHQYFACAVGTF